MSTIKFYTLENWVGAYLKEWGYDDSALTARLSGDIQKQNKSLKPDDVIALLNSRVLTLIRDIFSGGNLTDIQKLNYFKMVFLSRNLALKYHLFEPVSETEKETLAQYFHQFLAAPDLIVSDMHRQSIKTYHPFWRIKKTFAKGVKAVVQSVKKK